MPTILNYAVSLKLSRAVFLDRDGTIIREREYLSRPDQVSLFPETGPALLRLAQAGYKLFLVTNQSGVGRGYFTLADVERVHEHLTAELAGQGIRFERIYVAPEAPGVESRGRKPSPQYLHDARDEYYLDLSASFFVGDKLSDLQCGWNAGVQKSILVRTGYGREVEQEHSAKLANAVVVDDLSVAADWILRQ